MSVGILLFFIGMANAFAQSDRVVLGPNWQTWFTILLGLVVSLIGAYAKGLERRIGQNESRIEAQVARTSDIRELIRGEYHTKGELENILRELKDMVNKMHSRLDQLHVPSSFRNDGK